MIWHSHNSQLRCQAGHCPLSKGSQPLQEKKKLYTVGGQEAGEVGWDRVGGGKKRGAREQKLQPLLEQLPGIWVNQQLGAFCGLQILGPPFSGSLLGYPPLGRLFFPQWIFLLDAVRSPTLEQSVGPLQAAGPFLLFRSVN